MLSRTAVMFAVVFTVGLPACGDQDLGKVKIAVPAEHVAAVNALIPAEWKGKLEFELGEVIDKRGRNHDTYRLALPRGWKPAFMPGSLQPADADDFGRSAALGAVMSIRVGSNCNGECKPKDWAAEVDRVYYQQFTTGKAAGKVVEDTKRPTGRTLVFSRDESVEPGMGSEVNILTTWWKAGGSQHFICEAKLQDAAVALAPAFEQACALVSAE